MISVQLWEKIRQDLGNLERHIRSGNFDVLLQWLRENIHQVGRAKTADELVRELTGGPLSAEPFINYLEQKYGELYGI